MGKTLIILLCVFFITICPNKIHAQNCTALTSSSLYFIENKGQIKDQYAHPRNDIQFSLRANGMNFFIGNGQLHYQFSHRESNSRHISTPGKAVAIMKNISAAWNDQLTDNKPEEADLNECNSTYRMDVELMGANKNIEVIASEPQAYYENYYIDGCPLSGIQVHTYGKIIYKNIYPGIDWAIYTNNNKLEHEFIVGPGADASIIKLKYSGQTSLKINEDGSIVATTPMGTIKENPPVCYCADGSKINSKFILKDNILSYDVNNITGALVIDPTVEWGTYYGADTSTSPFYCIAKDDSAYVYLCGLTYSGTTGSISTTGSYQYTYNGGADAYVVKFDSLGSRIWGTYYGGLQGDWGNGIACDHSGNVFLVGTTGSPDSINIATPGCHQTGYGGGLWDGFLVRFNSAGVRQWATYVGGKGAEIPAAVFCDLLGHVYIGGVTNSGNNIATAGGFQKTNSGGEDLFLIQFDTSGALKWGTYYGGPNNEFGGIGCTDGLYAYLSGYTTSTTGISTPGSFQPKLAAAGTNDILIAKFDQSGSRLWGTYLGGKNDETTGGIICDDLKGLFILGSTASDTGIATPGCFQPARSGGVTDAFLARFDNVTGMRIWGTYFGGPGDENVDLSRITTDGNNVYITGYTTSTSGITTAGAWQTTYSGGTDDAFLAKFDDFGVEQWSTYFGGEALDEARAALYDGHGGLYLCGQTNSTKQIATPGSFLSTGGGGGTGYDYQGFLVRFTNPLDTTVLSVAEQRSTTKLSIYPTFNNGSFTLTGTIKSTINTVQVAVTDMEGRTIMKDEISVNNGIINSQIRLNNSAAPGEYFLKLVSQDNVTVMRFVKK